MSKVCSSLFDSCACDIVLKIYSYGVICMSIAAFIMIQAKSYAIVRYSQGVQTCEAFCVASLILLRIFQAFNDNVQCICASRVVESYHAKMH